MSIVSSPGQSTALQSPPLLSGVELLAWRRSMLAIAGSAEGAAAGLDWLLDLAGGIGWSTLQALWLQPERHVQLRLPLSQLEALWRRHCLEAEPLQYLVGCCPWRDLELSVAPGVLIPRQETEVLVDLALELVPAPPPEEPLCWADLGTGSGCLAAALARALPASCGLAVDVSPEALQQAAANLQALLPPSPVSRDPDAKSHAAVAPGAVVQLRHGSWWHAIEPWWGQLHLVVSNPPYIPSALLADLAPVVRDHEPALALDGGPDGLMAIRHLAAGAATGLAPGGVLLLEHHHDQSEEVLQLLAAAGLQDCLAHRDLEGAWRFASARRAPLAAVEAGLRPALSVR